MIHMRYERANFGSGDNMTFHRFTGKMGQTILLSSLLLGLGSGIALADVPNSGQELSALEQQLFNHPYPNDTDENRLSRIETEIFGKAHTTQSEEQRLISLHKFLTPPPTLAAAPAQPATHALSHTITQAPQNNDAANGVDYPTVTAMEQKVFHQSYAKEPLESRLARLEQRTTGHVQQGDLSDRTDQLSQMILGDTGNGPATDDNQIADNHPPVNGVGEPPTNRGAGSGPNNQAFTPDVVNALSPVEKKVLGRAYEQDNPESRLERLEMKVFNSTATDMSPEDRLYRVVSVVSAQKSGRSGQMAQGGMMGPGVSVGTGRGGMTVMGGGSTASTMGSMLLMILMSLL